MINPFKILYSKLVLINDTPHRIALGFGLGVFTGVMPGVGPIAALALAVIFRTNRASALLGSLFTNAWISFLIILPSLKLGSLLFGIKFQDLQNSWFSFLSNFTWQNLFNSSILKFILPAFIGYCSIAIFIGILAYLGILIAILSIKNRR